MIRLYSMYVRALRGAVVALAGLSGLGLMAMIAITCGDVIMRAFGRPIVGSYDLVRICGALTIACALPYTTAVKGHIAIEYFFHKLPPLGRIAVDTLTRLLGIALFGLLASRSALYGRQLYEAGETSQTLALPVFWIPYVIAVCCALVMLVILHHLLHPGRPMVAP